MAFSGAFIKPFRPAFDAGLAAAGNGLLNNLVAYWPLNEAAGANNALDLHTNALTLTQTASPGSAAGKVYAGARTFNGSSQYFSRASESLLQAGDVDFTVAAWVYLSSITGIRDFVSHYRAITPQRSYLLRYSGDATNRFLCYVSSDGTYVNGVTGTDLVASTFGAASVDTWYLVVFQHDGGANKITLSINNIENSKSWSAGIKVSTALFMVSGYDGSPDTGFSGRIGPVAMWKSAAGLGGCLSATQRGQLYNAGAGLAYAAFTT